MAASINLRSFPFSEDIICPHCHTKITVYDPTGSEYYVCNNCHSYLHKSATNGNIMTMQQVPEISGQPVIPIGTIGSLRDVLYKVIAYIEKEEVGTGYAWREYMLYSYEKGYAFLAEFDGHWTVIAGTAFYPELSGASETVGYANCDNVEYVLFNRYTPKITGLIGEYDWDVFEERIRATEFINPPYLLVKEQDNRNKNIVDYYLGEYLQSKEIAEAFKIDFSTFPDKVGNGANEPSPYTTNWDTVLKLSILVAIGVMLVQAVIVYLKPEQMLLDNSFTLNLQTPKRDSITLKHDSTSALASIIKSQPKTHEDSLAQAMSAYGSSAPAPDANGNYELKPFKTPSFTITNGPAPVEFEIRSEVDNNWFEATTELVNEKDNQTWDVSKEIEYYHGYEDGESWTEGSTTETVLLSGIPEGKYHINVYPYAGTSSLGSMNIKVTENVMVWRNVIVTLLLLCLYPLYCWWRMRRFETNRWMNSDYSPYIKTEGDDDE